TRARLRSRPRTVRFSNMPSAVMRRMLLSRAQALLDLKQYAAAREALRGSRAALAHASGDMDLLERLETQLEREKGSAMSVDCPHRALNIALTGSSRGLEHAHAVPLIQLEDSSRFGS